MLWIVVHSIFMVYLNYLEQVRLLKQAVSFQSNSRAVFCIKQGTLYTAGLYLHFHLKPPIIPDVSRDIS